MLRTAFVWSLPKGHGRRPPLLTLDEARERLETDHLPRSGQRHRPDDFPKPADKRFCSSHDKRLKFRLDELQAWLKQKGYPFVPYIVEKGVPLPNKMRANMENRELLEALQKMEVNDSLVIEEDRMATVRRNCDGDKRFVTRKEGEGKRRIWRIE